MSHDKSVENRSKIIILGSNGFIGSHLESFLKEEFTGYRIIGKDLPSLDLTKFSDVLMLRELLDSNTIIVMCSAIKKELGDNVENFLKNVLMVSNLSRLLMECNIKQFIFFSSAAVYGEETHNMDITEETPILPTSYYGIAKYTCEILLRKIQFQRKFKLVIIRPPVIYGPGDQFQYGPSGFIKAALNEAKIVLWGDGNEKREFVFVDDIVQVVAKIILSQYEGVVNVATGKSHTFIEIIGTLSSAIERIVEYSSKERTRKKVDHYFNNKKLLKLFPEIKFTELEVGMKKIINGLKQT